MFFCVVAVGPPLLTQLLSVLGRFEKVEEQLVCCRCTLSGVAHELLEHHGSQVVILDKVKQLRDSE